MLKTATLLAIQAAAVPVDTGFARAVAYIGAAAREY
jgi:hypothetical protein